MRRPRPSARTGERDASDSGRAAAEQGALQAQRLQGTLLHEDAGLDRELPFPGNLLVLRPRGGRARESLGEVGQDEPRPVRQRPDPASTGSHDVEPEWGKPRHALIRGDHESDEQGAVHPHQLLLDEALPGGVLGIRLVLVLRQSQELVPGLGSPPVAEVAHGKEPYRTARGPRIPHPGATTGPQPWNAPGNSSGGYRRTSSRWPRTSLRLTLVLCTNTVPPAWFGCTLTW